MATAAAPTFQATFVAPDVSRERIAERIHETVKCFPDPVTQLVVSYLPTINLKVGQRVQSSLIDKPNGVVRLIRHHKERVFLTCAQQDRILLIIINLAKGFNVTTLAAHPEMGTLRYGNLAVRGEELYALGKFDDELEFTLYLIQYNTGKVIPNCAFPLLTPTAERVKVGETQIFWMDYNENHKTFVLGTDQMLAMGSPNGATNNVSIPPSPFPCFRGILSTLDGGLDYVVVDTAGTHFYDVSGKKPAVYISDPSPPRLQIGEIEIDSRHASTTPTGGIIVGKTNRTEKTVASDPPYHSFLSRMEKEARQEPFPFASGYYLSSMSDSCAYLFSLLTTQERKGGLNVRQYDDNLSTGADLVSNVGGRWIICAFQNRAILLRPDPLVASNITDIYSLTL